MAGMQIQQQQRAVSGYIILQQTLKKYLHFQAIPIAINMVQQLVLIGELIGHQIQMDMVLPKVGLQVHHSLIIAKVI